MMGGSIPQLVDRLTHHNIYGMNGSEQEEREGEGGRGRGRRMERRMNEVTDYFLL